MKEIRTKITAPLKKAALEVKDTGDLEQKELDSVANKLQLGQVTRAADPENLRNLKEFVAITPEVVQSEEVRKKLGKEVGKNVKKAIQETLEDFHEQQLQQQSSSSSSSSLSS